MGTGQPAISKARSAKAVALGLIGDPMISGQRFSFLMFIATSLCAQQPITFQYFYDDLNQLARVVDSTGTSVQYIYDPAGNLTQVSRSTITPGALSILNITPGQAPVDGTLTIQGQGFSAIAANDLVTINGVTAIVVSATTTTLIVEVPLTATTGVIAVTVGGVTTIYGSNEVIIPVPVITSVTPKAVLAGTTATIKFTGANLAGSTFAFQPPASVVVSTLTVSPDGTTGSFQATLNATANGYFTLIANNGAGFSDSIIKLGFVIGSTSWNTISVPGSDPNADPDLDGLTNAQELAGGTDPLNPDTDSDRYPDGLEVLLGSDPLNPLSIPVISSAPYFESGLFSISNIVNPGPTVSSTQVASGPLFSILNTTSPAPTTVSAQVASGLLFSILDTANPAPTTASAQVASGLLFSILNTTNPAPTLPSTQLASGPLFSILNGVQGATQSASVSAGNSALRRNREFIIAALARGVQRIYGAAACIDSDGDGLCDRDERILGTDPFNADTDGDGFPDGLELALGSDPLDPNSIPNINSSDYFAGPTFSVSNGRFSAALKSILPGDNYARKQARQDTPITPVGSIGNVDRLHLH